jgi:hypothetical protein
VTRKATKPEQIGQLFLEHLNKGDLEGLMSLYEEDAVLADQSGCSGQLIPDTVLSFSSATAGANPSLNRCGRSQLYRCIK